MMACAASFNDNLGDTVSISTDTGHCQFSQKTFANVTKPLSEFGLSQNYGVCPIWRNFKGFKILFNPAGESEDFIHILTVFLNFVFVGNVSMANMAATVTVAVLALAHWGARHQI